ncbi:MAG: 4Fe-4S binding protein [Anaerolineae bacterium]|jgi:Fe-S-cluster-containing hydrogenase component 2|nr:4Fe-4S binding protein [Anaerolineae bacterium]
MAINVNEKRCPQNHPCPAVRVCPVNAISQTGFGAPTVDQDVCVDCGKCIRYCPMGVFSLTGKP